MKKIMLASIVFASAIIVGGQRAEAQRRYTPKKPTLSPYLDYFRRDSGTVSPYQTFIQRQQMLNNKLGMQSSAINNLQRQLQQRPTAARATGTGATFMNYSHFYPSARGGRR